MYIMGPYVIAESLKKALFKRTDYTIRFRRCSHMTFFSAVLKIKKMRKRDGKKGANHFPNALSGPLNPEVTSCIAR